MAQQGEPSEIFIAAGNVESAKTFFTDLFGWTVGEYEQGTYPVKLKGNVAATITPTEGNQSASINVCFTVDSVDSIVEKAQQKGATTLVPAVDTPKGRYATIQDPQGIVFDVFQKN